MDEKDRIHVICHNGTHIKVFNYSQNRVHDILKQNEIEDKL